MLIFTSCLAFYLAWNLGANDVANSMGTAVGSRAVTLRQALIIAGTLELLGALVFGQEVSQKLATGVVSLAGFVDRPEVLLWGMVAVLGAAGLWLNVATVLGLPVSSSHATVGAIAGVGWVALGRSGVNWRSIGGISVTWLLTPLLSAGIAALLYHAMRQWILERPHPWRHLQEWIPWLAVLLTGTFGVIVLPPLAQRWMQTVSPEIGRVSLPLHTGLILLDGLVAIGITIGLWRYQDRLTTQAPPQSDSEYPLSELILARFQVLSACCVAFAHGSNDVGNAIAPLAMIVHLQQTQTVPLAGFPMPMWVLGLGGLGLVSGLAVFGQNVIATVGEGIISLRPSGGFCAELATAITILLASRWGLPVSTSHALVGAVVGIGFVQNWRSVQFQTLRTIGLTWFATIPMTAGMAAGLFSLMRIPLA